MRLVALVAPVLVAAYLPRPVTEVVPDAASCVAAQTDRVLAARSGLVAAQRVE